MISAYCFHRKAPLTARTRICTRYFRLHAVPDNILYQRTAGANCDLALERRQVTYKPLRMLSNDPYSGFNFIVEIDGNHLASFESVSDGTKWKIGLAHSVQSARMSDRKATRHQEYGSIRLAFDPVRTLPIS